MRTATFTVNAPKMFKEAARSMTGLPSVGVIMGLNMTLSGLAQIAIRAHKINDREIIRILNSMGITRDYLGDLIPAAKPEKTAR